MRACPRCTWPLSIFEHQGVELDHCRRCGGTFLDPGEAASLFGEAAEPAHWKEEYNVTLLGPSKLQCPTGHAALEAFDVKYGTQAVEVDVCPRCHGLWLDKDEGTKLYNIAAGAREHAQNKELGIDKPGLGSYVFQLLTGFPIEVWNPVRRKPVVVYTLTAILIALFLFELVVVGALGQSFESIAPNFLMVPSEVTHGRKLWTILSSGFFHGGFMHIIGNLYFLWIFGDNVEDALGRKKFVILYAVSLVAGSLLHVVFNWTSHVPVLGASGAISGVMGAYLLLFPRVKMWVMIIFVRLRIGVIWYLGFWIVYQVIMGLAGGQGVAFWAHAGGFFAGMGMAVFYRKSVRT